jgi:hypothetical protein
MKRKPDMVKAGSVYDIDGRKGKLTIRLVQDVDLADDTFFDAVIVDGTVRYASNENNIAQRAFGQGTPGDVVTFRTTLNHFVRRRPELEGQHGH